MSAGHAPPITSANATKDDSKGTPLSNAVSGNSGFGGALARTVARAGALYFSRPVRLFRPQKVSPWTTLRGLAAQQGTSFSPTFVINVFRTQGWQIFQHHMLPPILANTAMGTLLFTSYTLAQYEISSHPALQPHTTAVAAMAGATAGAIHGLVGAPLDNVARYLEKGDTSWRQAWAEAFHLSRSAADFPVRPGDAGAQKAGQALADMAREDPRQPTAKQVMQELKKQELWPPPTMKEAREAKEWIWEWRHMAGRGWTGWKWGCAKDITGFASFFAIFDLSRRSANYLARELTPPEYESANGRRPSVARAAHGITLVSGGVIGGLAYEATCRPWDAARALWIVNKSRPIGERQTLPQVVLSGMRERGVVYFFRSVRLPGAPAVKAAWYWRMLPTLARVGPWGIAFLVWEGVGGTVTGE
ncbi:hypothetical protein CALCODRAFT_504903 [Calocera cornea HHB12733]|uniref:Mitochondrial carrier n=1 Tax=Calocera cornea HHB12733 TaxID=1353952 RepID=A0A165C5J1_9BASI|nr:hypothetical protein CALCODRAFT_504903 [Calocera cornea HHB12733]